MIPIPIKLLHPDAQIPKYQTTGASGMDLCALTVTRVQKNSFTVHRETNNFTSTIAVTLNLGSTTVGSNTLEIEAGSSLYVMPRCRVLIGTGISLSIPPGYEGQIRPRSGWALKDGVTVLNSPGTIDSDYKGEVKVLLINLGHESVEIKRGDRVAQLVIAPVVKAELVLVDQLETSARGAGGFGSSGR